MSALEVFTFSDQQVRTVMVDGAPWFVLADVARVLGLSEVSRLASRLPDGVRQTHPIVDSLGRTQNATVVSEAGLYRVVLRSDAPNAEPFIAWVTEDVLPTIREMGRYGSEVAMLAALPSSAVLALAAAAAKRAEEAEAHVAVLAPKADRWDEIASAAGDFSVGDVAKMLCRAGVETGQNRLFRALDDLKWTFRRGESPRRAMQSAVDAGLVVERAQRPVTNQQTGELRQVPPQIRITGKGLERLRDELVPRAALVVVS